MKWPWVSRELLDEQIERANRLAAQVNALTMHNESLANIVNADGARLDNLLAKYHELKLQGAAKPEPVPALQRREPDAVTQAVIAMAKGKPGLFAHYNEHVARRRAEGTEESEIAKEILTGVEDDMGVPS